MVKYVVFVTQEEVEPRPGGPFERRDTQVSEVRASNFGEEFSQQFEGRKRFFSGTKTALQRAECAPQRGLIWPWAPMGTW